MGCDGSTIPKRDELVKTKKKKEQKDRVSERVYRWKYCSLSQTPLKSPVVACELGRLYNKEEVITRLLNKTQVKSDVCCKCGATFSPIDLITLNPSEAELAILEAAMEEQRAKAKLAKKSAKRKASDGEQVKEKSDKKQKMANKGSSSSGASGSSKAGTSGDLV